MGSVLVSFIKIGKTVKGTFLERPNRFLAYVRIGDTVVPSFTPNPGRMRELLTPETEVLLKEVVKDERKTSYDLVGVVHDGQIISIDARVPNKLILEALKNGELDEFSEYDVIDSEHVYGHSRFDFLLSNKDGDCLLEVKSCTLVKDGVAMFPDAKTERGSKHLRELMRTKKEGYRASILFLIQRTDAHTFCPNDEADPQFGRALREAAAEGVEVYVYCSEFVEDRIILKGRVKVDLDWNCVL